MEKLLDIYTDYLHTTFGLATATDLSRMLDGVVSHDKITRMLSEEVRGSKELWLSIKPLVRRFEQDSGCLVFDDSIIEKPHSDENELVNWHFDHTKNRSVKGINILTAFYHCQKSENDIPLRVPVAFEPVEKPILYSVLKTRKVKHRSEKTKNELLREMVLQSIRNDLKFTYVLGDNWFASVENMRFIEKHKKTFIFSTKSNRLATLSEKGRKQGHWTRIDELSLTENTPVKVWLKGLEFPVTLVKQVFRNKDGSTGFRYLLSNSDTLNYQCFKTLFQKRWSVEEYHKSIKQNTAIGKSPTRKVKTQKNHLYASILSYVKLERYKLTTSLNHFAIKSRLYIAALKAAFKELNELKLSIAA